jgi:hypothetical protein
VVYVCLRSNGSMGITDNTKATVHEFQLETEICGESAMDHRDRGVSPSMIENTQNVLTELGIVSSGRMVTNSEVKPFWSCFRIAVVRPERRSRSAAAPRGRWRVVAHRNHADENGVSRC